jgi:hypothetical protein
MEPSGNTLTKLSGTRWPGVAGLGSRPAVAAAAAVVIVVLAATLVLWAHYGTAVFFEMIVAGLAACI